MNDIRCVLTYLNSIYNSLTKSEKKIADFILTEPKNVIYMTISEISSKSLVGDTTVLRFCRKMGFSSFQDFKLALAQDITNKDSDFEELDFQLSKNDSLLEVSRKVINYDLDILEETFNLISNDELCKARDGIINANKIEIFGVGASIITGLDVYLKFMRIGYNISCNIDFHAQMMAASLLTKNDLAIGISFSGSSKDTNKVLNIAKNAGAQILCVTRHANSPITKIGDITLLHGGKEDPLQGGNFSSKIAQISVFDILYHAVYMKTGHKVSKSKGKTSKAITEHME